MIEHVTKESNLTLLVGFGLQLVLMAALAVVAVSEILSVRAELNQVVDKKLVKSQLARTMFDASRERALLLMMLQYEQDPFERDELMMRFRSGAERFMLAREKLYEMELSAQEQQALEHSVELASRGAEASNRLLDLLLDEFELDTSRREQAARIMREEIVPARAKVGELMMEIGWIARESGEQAVINVEQSYRQTLLLLVLICGAILLLSFTIIWVVYRRITYSTKQIHRIHDDLENIASYDELTGLVNRRVFEERFQHEVEKAAATAQQLALLYLDLDGFKAVNDTRGHAAGDRVLQLVSKRFQQLVRDVDLVGRMGGDEFAIVLSSIHADEQATVVAQRIVESTSQPMRLEEGVEVNIGTSIGVALYPQHGSNHEVLMRQADQAMYVAKREGKGVIRLAS